mgnify:CR=1 FL=1
MSDNILNKHSIDLVISQHPNHSIYTMSSTNLTELETERNYFIELFGSDKVGNDVIFVSPIIVNSGRYTFMIMYAITGIINKYRRQIGNYQPRGFMDYITR